ncbi:MAG: hypothetical protein FVQ80_01325 [Planctomycetes bacterium]|nr:hypothetical protein [Planctomycetota bacterium]
MDIKIQKQNTRVFNQVKIDEQGSPIAVMENGEPKLDVNGNPVYETELKARISFYFSEAMNYPVLTTVVDWPATLEQIEAKVLAIAQQHKDAAEQTLILNDNVKLLDNLQVS